jgi:hypothetical protein
MMREKRSRTLSACRCLSKTMATPRTKYQPVAVTWMSGRTSPGPGSAGLEVVQLGLEVVAHLDQVRQLDRFELDPALAHQRHDHGAAHQVVARQRQAAHDGELALAQRVVVLGSVLAFWL